jgi:hypothetical protein
VLYVYLTYISKRERPGTSFDSLACIAIPCLTNPPNYLSFDITTHVLHPSLKYRIWKYNALYNLQVIITKHAWNNVFYARYDENFGNWRCPTLMSNMIVHTFWFSPIMTDVRLVLECLSSSYLCLKKAISLSLQSICFACKCVIIWTGDSLIIFMFLL